MLGMLFSVALLLGAEPSLPSVPNSQFELGLGLGFAYDLVGFQLGVRVGKFDAFVGLSPFTFLAHTINGGFRFIASNEPGFSFMVSLQGGLLWSPPDDQTNDSTYQVSAIIGARYRFPGAWFTQFGAGPAVAWGTCQERGCLSARFVHPVPSIELGLGYAF